MQWGSGGREGVGYGNRHWEGRERAGRFFFYLGVFTGGGDALGGQSSITQLL